jgi:Flp pilus assembly pilin Flp
LHTVTTKSAASTTGWDAQGAEFSDDWPYFGDGGEGHHCVSSSLRAKREPMKIAARTAARLVATRRGQEGQGLAEYSMLLALVAMVAIAGLIFLGGNISAALTSIGTTVSTVIP